MRIIYGVAGEGFGHSSRSHLIGQQGDILWPNNKQFFRVLHRTLAEVCPPSDGASASCCAACLLSLNR